MFRSLLLTAATTLLAVASFSQGNTKDVYQRDTGPGFFKKMPEINPKDVPSRELNGIVRNEDGDPLKGAIVTVTNMKTKAGRSFVTKDDGRYRFDQLVKSDDYEVKAKLQGKETDTKSLSTYDPREKPTLNLQFQKEAPRKETAESTAAKPSGR